MLTYDDAVMRIDKFVRIVPSGAEVRIVEVSKDEAKVQFFGATTNTKWFPLSKLNASATLDARCGVVRPTVYLPAAPALERPAQRRSKAADRALRAAAEATELSPRVAPPPTVVQVVEAQPVPAPAPVELTLDEILASLQSSVQGLRQRQADAAVAKVLHAEAQAQAARLLADAEAQLAEAETALADARAVARTARASLDALMGAEVCDAVAG